jgi:predicted dienelactone hydrolase
MKSHWHCRFVCVLAVILLPAIALAAETNYDPLAVPDLQGIRTLDVTVKDEMRNREIPIRVYLPTRTTPQPVVLFSHGLGGSRENSPYLGKHWAARGYVVVFIQHHGSDVSVWKGKAMGEGMQALRQAASLPNFLLRTKDISVVLDQLQRWNKFSGHALAGRLDLEHVGMSGHSFGAVTTQAVSGQSAAGGRVTFTDPRIKAAVAMSPSSPRRGDPKQDFASVKIPWLLMTGTKDVAPIGNEDVKSRLAVFTALPSGGKYEVVLDGAEHSAFGDRPLPNETGKRNPNHHRVILALSTAFWDAYLRHDTAAKAWLDGAGPKSLLEKGDEWRKK